MRKLKRSIARANMERAGYHRINKKGGDVKWHIHDERSLLALQVSAVLLPSCYSYYTCWCSWIAFS